MSGQPLFLDDGTRIVVGERIGRGGEGDVHLVADDPAKAVKLYTVSDLDDRRDKVRAMVRAGLAARSDLVAFPVAVVNRGGGRFAGFTMLRVVGRKPLHELYAPGARKAAFPRADYRFLVRVATNVARAVGAVHETGCVIGDINHSGILVSDQATVALIDADSFQFIDGARRHLCRVGVPEYTPPELQGVRLDGVERRVEHDRFGLAVALFQLLFMGRHPFSGSYSAGDMPIERAIGEHRFAYTIKRQVGMRPPPAAPTLADVPSEVAAAFEAAFSPSGERPDARRWVQLLAAMEKGLRVCGASSLHHHAPSAPECPWCRMEKRQGVTLFLPHAQAGVSSTPTDPGAAGFDLPDAWRAIQAVPHPASTIPAPRLPDCSPEPSEGARIARTVRRKRRALGLAWFLAAIGVLVAAASLWPASVIAMWVGAVKLFADDPGTKEIRREKREVDQRFETAVTAWRGRAGDEGFCARLKELEGLRDTYGRLGLIETQQIANYQRNRRFEQLAAYLDSFLIRNQKLKGMGASRIATLASYGIDTALDVSEGKVLAVPGFGRKTAAALLDWRRQLEGRFVFNERPNAADAARIAAIRAETVRNAADLRRRLLAGPSVLTGVARDIETRRTAIDPQLAALHQLRVQLAVDLAA